MEEKKEMKRSIKLHSGQEMPIFGLGTFLVKDVDNIVYQSIKQGVRLIDTASRYQNEKEVGDGINKAIQEGIVKREELFVVTKLWVGDKENPEEAIKKSLALLNLSYVDCYLDHWPMQIFEWEGKNYVIPTHVVWKSMENLVRKGYTKSIGVCNYNVMRLMDLIALAEIKPVINQIEYHPYLVQDNLIDYCKSNQIEIMSYNVLCRGVYVSRFHSEEKLNLLDESLVKEIADTHKTTTGVIAISFSMSQNLITIVATNNPNRMKENIEVFDYKLSEDEIKRLKTLDRNGRCNQSKQWPFFKGVDLFA